MRKVTFIIDDLRYFKNYYHFNDAQMEYFFGDQQNFKAIYTLYGREIEGTFPDRYELTDAEGCKMDIDTLNGYQKGIVLSDCESYYAGRKFTFGDEPCGVVEIIDETIDEYEYAENAEEKDGVNYVR